jgi:membrane associated rhomboid family serine protease
MTKWVGRLIMANILVYFLEQIAPWLGAFALVPALLPIRPWTAFTYMFLHAGLAHIFFNMLSLYFFGPAVEMRLGGRRFITLYVLSGLSGALFSVVTPYVPIVGASGAIFGVLLAFAWFWPRQPVYIWGVLGVEARWLVLIMTGLSLFGGLGGGGGGGGGIAHFAHLGGFAGGWLYLSWLKHHSPAAEWQRKLATDRPRTSGGSDIERWRTIDAGSLHPVNRDEYQRVMAKVETVGTGSLTPSERDFLDRFSQR